ncbi:hypothetical protein [Deminuibacter soli]|uniref:VWA domain-containing protein n=1 Tax=Deminuibacter soli TaxID=2291815 RepID=A0A3E1NLE2_9BACT|nr:hypothetical protein [Deminuibacter soli]RFM28664.1 hypothetical protein DXN05_07675 [Deminuibacter soli]
MKKVVGIPILLLLTCSLRAQSTKFIDSLLNNRILRVPAYESDTISHNQLLFQMQYAKSLFVDTTGASELKGAQILSVDLLFTDYPAHSDLKPLNKRRLIALCQLVPGIEKQKNISWTIVRQMDGKDPESAGRLHHGFVINYRKPYTPEDRKRELTIIQQAIPDTTVPYQPADETPGKIHQWAIIHQGNTPRAKTFMGRPLKKLTDQRAKLEPPAEGDSIVAITPDVALNKYLIDPKMRKMVNGEDSLFLLLGPRPDPGGTLVKAPEPVAKPVIPAPDPVPMPQDSTVLHTFARNKFEHMLVIADVTGSMSPYIVQLVQWMQQHEKRSNIDYCLCFNDGDNRIDDLKYIGNTGGTYGAKVENSKEMADLIQTTMEKGDGGDLEENPCEAVIKGIEAAPDSKNVVLIADSWAPARDLQLVGQIKKPVQVVICGKRLGVHPDLITIALVSGGSLHFINEDILDLSPLKQGKEMFIHNRYYRFNGKQVVEAVH